MRNFPHGHVIVPFNPALLITYNPFQSSIALPIGYLTRNGFKITIISTKNIYCSISLSKPNTFIRYINPKTVTTMASRAHLD